jgi:hypothetical protein
LGAYEAVMTAGDPTGRIRSAGPRQRASFRRWQIVEPPTDPSNLLTTLGPLGLQFVVEVYKPVRKGHHGIALFNADRQLMWAWAVNGLVLEPGVHEFRYTFPVLPLRPGSYYWQVSLWDDGDLLDIWDCMPEMVIATEVHQHPQDEWNGILNIPCEFDICNKQEAEFAKDPRL